MYLVSKYLRKGLQDICFKSIARKGWGDENRKIRKIEHIVFEAVRAISPINNIYTNAANL